MSFRPSSKVRIEQMRAYGELIANVAKTVDQFMTDNISAGRRTRLAGASAIRTRSTSKSTARQARFAEGARRRRRPRSARHQGRGSGRRLAEISRDLGVNPPITDISDPNAELRLVTAARLQMAKSRQQLLASMVMLGINRIVVTDGIDQRQGRVRHARRGQGEAQVHGLDARQEVAAVQGER